MERWLRVARLLRWFGGRADAAGRAVVDRVDRRWDRWANRWDERPVVRDVRGASVVVLFLLVNAARSAFDAGIAKIHPEGIDGVSTNSLHEGRAAITEAFAVWDEGYDRLRDLLSFTPVSLAVVQTLLELVLVPLAFAVLYGVVRWLRRRTATIGAAGLPTILRITALGVLGYTAIGAFDQLVELALLARWGWAMHLAGVLQLASAVRRLLLPLVLVACVLSLVRLLTTRADPTVGGWRSWWRGTGTIYRVVLVVAVVHAALLTLSIPGAQSQDALRLWLARPHLALVGGIATALLSLTLASIALRLGTVVTPRRSLMSRRATLQLLGIGAGLAALGAVGRWGPFGRHSWNAGILAAGLLLSAVALLSLPLPSGTVDNDVHAPGATAEWVVPATLAFAPPAVLGLALVRAAVPSTMDDGTSSWLFLYAAVAAAIGVLGWCLARAYARRVFVPGRSRRPAERRTRFIVIVTSTLGLFVLTTVLVVHDPWAWAPRVGVIGLLGIFLSGVVVAFGAVGNYMEDKPLPAALDLLGLRRLPVLVTLVVWGLLTHALAEPGYHDLTTIDDAELPANPQLGVGRALDAWLAANTPVGAASGAVGERAAVPLLFVTASGGGLKAAAFTAAALDCATGATARAQAAEQQAEQQQSDQQTDVPVLPASDDSPCAGPSAWSRLFAASGASGGSVGIASVLAERERGGNESRWVSERLGYDLLSPELGWQLFVEVPNALLGFNPRHDRAEILQESWRRQFVRGDRDPGGRPFYEDRASDASGPLVFFGGTNLNDGCRVNISPVRAGTAPDPTATDAAPIGFDQRLGPCQNGRLEQDWSPGLLSETHDLTDYLCGANVDLVTAAFLSARFPLVSPTGTIRCEVVEEYEDGTVDTEDRRLSIGDGGYRDNSGAGAVLETWEAIEPMVRRINADPSKPCVVPVLLEIGNGYAGLQGQSTAADVSQLLAPVVGAQKVFGDLTYGPIEQLAATFVRPLEGVSVLEPSGDAAATRFFRVSLADHPGVTAPLGWSLSRSAVGDLVDQLLKIDANAQTLRALKQVLDPERGVAPLRCTAG